MTCSPAQLEANRQNALNSTGPKTEAGKARSRANGYKHGLTGEGVVQTPEEAEKVADLTFRMRAEMNPTSEYGRFLVERTARLMVRLRRCAEFSPFQVVEGEGEGEGQVAFNISDEATRIDQYEAAAERSLFRTRREFLQVEAESRPHVANHVRREACRATASPGDARLASSSRTLSGGGPHRQATPPYPPLLSRSPLDDLRGMTSSPSLPTNQVPFAIGKPS